MKQPMAIRNFLLSLLVTGVLGYFMLKSPSPKIIFVPFLICGLSLAGKSLMQLTGNSKWAAVFHKLFVIGFLLFWFGFLSVAVFICLRDKSYGMLLFTLPFWVIGFFVVKNKLLGKKSSKESSPFRFAVIVSAVLVTVAIAAGILMLVLGIQRRELGLLLGGAFFVLVSFAFALGWMTVNGKFENSKVDVLGLYMGIVVAGLGIGILVWKFTELGLWILVPILMAIAGLLQIIKCINRSK